MALLKSDELNNLRSMPFDKYFGEMAISKADKIKRVRLAEKFESFFIDLFLLLATMTSNELYEVGFVEAEYYQKLLLLMKDNELDSYQREKLRRTLNEVVETTVRHVGEDYFVSDDRARYVAENEANTFYNYEEHQEAIISGKTKKTWHTMLDNRVRISHEIEEGVTIPIHEPFIVGTSQMMFPKDDSLGASADEIINCRCSLSYS